METQTGSAEEGRNPRTIFLALIIVVILVAGGLIGYVLYANATAPTAPSPALIQAGDKVTMNYIGRLPDGRVFDTSIYTVANDNGTYPKSLTFTLRANTSYKPFPMIAGNYGQGGTIKGFALGVVGMHNGTHAFIDVPPGEGYAVNPGLEKNLKIVENVSAVETLTETQFISTFGTDPILFHTYTHFFWGWNVVVVDDTASTVVLKSEPTVGQVVYPFGNPSSPTAPGGWPVIVQSYDPAANGGNGQITIRHDLSPEDVYFVKGTDIDGKTFVVTGYNAVNGTFTISKNDPDSGYSGELAGRELTFEVFILKVEKA